MGEETAIFISNSRFEQIIWGVDQLDFRLGRKGNQLAPTVRKIWKNDSGSKPEYQECGGKCGEKEMVGKCRVGGAAVDGIVELE